MTNKIQPLFAVFVAICFLTPIIFFAGCVAPNPNPFPGAPAYTPDNITIDRIAAAVKTGGTIAATLPVTAPFAPLIDLAGAAAAAIITAVSLIIARRKSAAAAALPPMIAAIEAAGTPELKGAIRENSLLAGTESTLNQLVSKLTK